MSSSAQAALATCVAGACLLAGHEAVGQVIRRNLVSDGSVPAEHTDANLVNAWGLVPNPTGVWWISDNHTGLSTLYDGDGNVNPLVVTIPPPSSSKGIGSPTGIVYNGTSEFVVSDGAGASGPARFIFAGEDGTITAWAPQVPLPPPSTAAFVVIDDSDEVAIYKGLAVAFPEAGPRLYTTDFHNNRTEAYDGEFEDIKLRDGFVDPDLPSGYAPFGIRALNGSVYLTFALQDDKGEDDVPGPGHGYVDVFDLDGVLVKRLVSEGLLNSPWGLAIAPPNFGPLSGALLVGNFGDGRINAYDATTGDYLGTIADTDGDPIEVDGLWGIDFGNAAAAGPNNALFFAAGPDDEEHGLFGRLDVDVAVLCDVNHDGVVNAADLAILLGDWNQAVSAADIDGNGHVDAKDLALLLGNWTRVG